MTSNGSKNNFKYKLVSQINDAVYYSDDLKKTTEIDGVIFYIVKDDKDRNLMIKKDSVRVVKYEQ